MRDEIGVVVLSAVTEGAVVMQELGGGSLPVGAKIGVGDTFGEGIWTFVNRAGHAQLAKTVELRRL
jgi:hypothetical protein